MLKYVTKREVVGFLFTLFSFLLVDISDETGRRMTQKALKLRAEVEIHSVSCPGVFFPCKGPVSAQRVFANKARLSSSCERLIFQDFNSYPLRTFTATDTLTHQG